MRRRAHVPVADPARCARHRRSRLPHRDAGTGARCPAAVRAPAGLVPDPCAQMAFQAILVAVVVGWMCSVRLRPASTRGRRRHFGCALSRALPGSWFRRPHAALGGVRTAPRGLPRAAHGPHPAHRVALGPAGPAGCGQAADHVCASKDSLAAVAVHKDVRWAASPSCWRAGHHVHLRHPPAWPEGRSDLACR